MQPPTYPPTYRPIKVVTTTSTTTTTPIPPETIPNSLTYITYFPFASGFDNHYVTDYTRFQTTSNREYPFYVFVLCGLCGFIVLINIIVYLVLRGMVKSFHATYGDIPEVEGEGEILMTIEDARMIHSRAKYRPEVMQKTEIKVVPPPKDKKEKKQTLVDKIKEVTVDKEESKDPKEKVKDKKRRKKPQKKTNKVTDILNKFIT
ncbi:hypothetical protein SNEBB_010414 [Seison nebaliae]|nr:hypothetical protein SNEBB_010414 [Seison nebaliae]